MKPNRFTPLRPLFFSAVAIILVSALSCKDELADTNEIVFPATGVSYIKQVEPLFQNACAYAGCHDNETQAGGYNMETYNTVMKPGVVIPKDTANSRLVWRIEGKPGFELMPLNRPKLNENQIKGLKQWIMEGALSY